MSILKTEIADLIEGHNAIQDSSLELAQVIIDKVRTHRLQPGEPTDDTPHEVHLDLEMPRAEFPAPGVTLWTLNGKTIGNAIIVQSIDDGSWLIETDFGNRVKLTQREILTWFKLGYQQDFGSWKAARQALTRANTREGPR